LDLAIIRKLSAVGQGCGLMTEKIAPPVTRSGHLLALRRQWKRSALYPKFRQIRLEKRGGQHFDVQ
jgi:hypothetical protein